MIIMSPSLADITSFYPLPQPPYNFSYMKNVNNLEIIKKGKVRKNNQFNHLKFHL